MPRENPAISSRTKTLEAKKDELWSWKSRLPLMSPPRFDSAPGAPDAGHAESLMRMVGDIFQIATIMAVLTGPFVDRGEAAHQMFK